MRALVRWRFHAFWSSIGRRPRIRCRLCAISMKRLVELVPHGGGQLLSKLRHGWLERLADLLLQRPTQLRALDRP